MSWPTIYLPVYDEVATTAQWITFRDALLYLKGAVDFWSCSYTVYEAAIAPDNGAATLLMGPAPSFLSGFKLTKATFSHATAGDTRATDLTVVRGRQMSTPDVTPTWVDMFSTHVTIDQGEYCSLDAAPGVINDSYADVAEGDLWSVYIFAHQAGCKGLFVTLEFEKP